MAKALSGKNIGGAYGKLPTGQEFDGKVLIEMFDAPANDTNHSVYVQVKVNDSIVYNQQYTKKEVAEKFIDTFEEVYVKPFLKEPQAQKYQTKDDQ